MNYPKLRPISAVPLERPDGQYICLHDPNHYTDKMICISPETFFVIRCFDGQHSLRDIQDAFMRQFGSLLYTEQLQQIVSQLDELLFLESPAFSAHLRQLRREFARLPVRPSSHKGEAYPDNVIHLIKKLNSYFTSPKGPGTLPETSFHTSGIKAIMAPHIEFESGGAGFAWAYHVLAASDAERFIILGTSHVPMSNFFALTRKAFETPFGRLETDQAFVDTLAGQLSYDPFEDELIHKTEHSIEFQVVFLQYLFRQRPITIVPILCGGLMYEAIVHNEPLAQTPQLEESIRCLHGLVKASPKTCIIASVDFSHIGVNYGHKSRPDPATLRRVGQVDHTLLTAMKHVAHEDFATQLYRNQNATQVCGIVPMYTTLRLIEGTKGTLLHYDCVEFRPDSFVSFASMVWKGPGERVKGEG